MEADTPCNRDLFGVVLFCFVFGLVKLVVFYWNQNELYSSSQNVVRFHFSNDKSLLLILFLLLLFLFLSLHMKCIIFCHVSQAKM